MAYDERRSTGLGAGTVTIALIAVNILAFLFGTIDRQGVGFLALLPAYVVPAGAWWQVVSYMFVHLSWTAIFFNMLALFLFGTQLEHRMGSVDFLLFYAVCGIGAGFVTLLINNATGIGIFPVMGASGAIFGLLLAFAAFFPYDKIYIFGILPMQAPTAVLVFAGIEILLQIFGGQSGVAHLSLLTGLLFAYFFLLFRYRINALSLFSRRR